MILQRQKTDRGPEPRRTPAEAADRARQLLEGIRNATTALGHREPELAKETEEAGRRLAAAAVALAESLARNSGGPGAEDPRRAAAEELLARGLEVLHRLHFEIIRHDLQETQPETVPAEEARRLAVELERAAEGSAGDAA
jgi:hypothetical protein